MVKLWKKQQMVEEAPEEEGASTPADQHSAPAQTDTHVEQKAEVTDDDRDDSSSSSSSESDSSEADGAEKESKQSQDAEKD